MAAAGGGGRLMRQLIDKMFGAAFRNEWSEEQHDGAILPDVPGRQPVLTTDSFVVDPLSFPGGDIGTLAVCGTVNDLAMCGAEPKYLTCGFVIEEGLPMEQLWSVVCSMQSTAEQAGVQIVTGDTKVVDRGKADKLFINTAGLGFVEPGHAARPGRIQANDVVLLSGDVGRHGVVVLAARDGLGFETEIESDCQPLNHATRGLLDAGVEVHCFRDLTRGGLATGMVELAGTAGLACSIREAEVPVREDVRGACELLGLAPLYVANAGRFVAVVSEAHADRAIEVLRGLGGDHQPVRIGSFQAGRGGRVTLQTTAGSERILDMLSGEQLPRIC